MQIHDLELRAPLPQFHSAVVRCLASAAVAAVASAQHQTHRVSVQAGGAQANAHSRAPDISRDGRWIVFHSAEPGIAQGGGDTNGVDDVYVRYLIGSSGAGGTNLRISTGTAGIAGNQASDSATISGDSRFVFFASWASDLVAADANGAKDVFAYELSSGIKTLVSVSGAGAQGNAASDAPECSGDGRFAVFSSLATNLAANDANAARDVFVRDRQLGTTSLVSVNLASASANAASAPVGISDDGLIVVFDSSASDLVGGDTNGAQDVFVRDLSSGVTTLLSRTASGAQSSFASSGGNVSADGRFVAFTSRLAGLVAGDSNNVDDVFVYDRGNASYERVSLDSAGAQVALGGSGGRLTADGRFVAFLSRSNALVPLDANGTAIHDLFLRDRLTATTRLVDLHTNGAQANGSTVAFSLAGAVPRVVYASGATTLVNGDTNSKDDVFLYAPPGVEAVAYCTSKLNSAGCYPNLFTVFGPVPGYPSTLTFVASSVLNQKLGLFFYGFAPNATPFQGGYLCVAQPLRRTPLQSSGGNPPPDDCSGTYAFDFAALLQSGSDPDLVLGTTVHLQCWSRDPASASTTGLTHGLAFTLQ